MSFLQFHFHVEWTEQEIQDKQTKGGEKHEIISRDNSLERSRFLYPRRQSVSDKN